MQSVSGGTTPRSASSVGTTSAGAIEARGLVKTYPAPGKTRVRALDGLTLSVRRGSIFALVGPNGAGQRSGADQAATGRENLILQGHLYGLPTKAAKARADELLDRFQLTEAGGRFVRTYSGGMQRRLDVALGLVHKPRVLFLDEPTTGLDPESRAAMWDEITGLATGDEVTVLLTTHYLDEADKLAGSLAIVDKGRVVAEGEPDRLKSELGAESLDEVYLHYAGRRYSDATRVTEVAGR